MVAQSIEPGTEVALPRPLVQRLLKLSQSSPDAEICGLIGALNDQPRSAYPVQNVSDQPATRFEMPAEDVAATMQRIRQNGETPFAIYHSHPTEPPVPSARDIAECGHPELLYLIVSLNTKGVLELRGWRLHDDEPRAVDLRI